MQQTQVRKTISRTPGPFVEKDQKMVSKKISKKGGVLARHVRWGVGLNQNIGHQGGSRAANLERGEPD